MQYTDNYNFNKPEDSDAGDAAYFNENFDAIDGVLKEQADNITGAQDAIDELGNNPVELWVNHDTTTAFNAQTVTLNDNISNYRYYYIEYKLHASYGTVNATGLIPIIRGTTVVGAKNLLATRDNSVPNGTTIAFGDCQQWSYGGTATTGNNYCIPVRVMAIK